MFCVYSPATKYKLKAKATYSSVAEGTNSHSFTAKSPLYAAITTKTFSFKITVLTTFCDPTDVTAPTAPATYAYQPDGSDDPTSVAVAEWTAKQSDIGVTCDFAY